MKGTMKKTTRRVVSVVLALAMIFTSMNYTPMTAKADDYSQLEFTEVSGMNGTYAYCITNNSMVGFDRFNFYGGNYMQLIGSGDSKFNESTATVNGEDITKYHTWFDKAPAIYGVNVNELEDNAYYAYKIVSDGGTLEFVLKKGTPSTSGENPTDPVETTEPVGPTDPTTLSALKDAYVYNFTETGEGFKVGFSDPNKITKPEGATYTYTLNINGQKIENIEAKGTVVDLSSLGLVEGTEYTVTMNAVYKNGDVTVTSPDSAVTKFVYNTTATTAYDNGIPQIFISTSTNDTTSGINLYTDTSKTKVQSALMIKGADGTIAASNYGRVNVRGNSTSLADKKAYNIKFDKAINPFNMGSAKKWSLLANIFDKTLIRNQIGMDFQRGLEASQGTFPEDGASKVFTSNCQPVDLYIDGKYLGTYSLIESVETGTDRVNIDIGYSVEDTDEYAEGATPDVVTLDGKEYSVFDALLELETERGDEDAYFFPTNLARFAINEPERTNKDKYSSQPGAAGSQPEWVGLIKEFVLGFEAALQSNDFDRFSQFIDVDSFVDFYITSEYFMTKDIGLSSTRFYIRNGKLYAGPLWDLDLSSGNVDDHQGADAVNGLRSKEAFQWFGKLMGNETFYKKVQERYEAILPQIKALYADGGAVDQAVAKIQKSATTNYENAYNYKRAETDEGRNVGWGYNYLYGTNGSAQGNEGDIITPGSVGSYGSGIIHDSYQKYIDEYKSWLQNRNEWLMTEFNVSDKDADIAADDYEKLIANKYFNLALDKNTTLYKTCHQEGKQEYLNDGKTMINEAGVSTQVCALTNSDATNAWGTDNEGIHATVDLGAVYKASDIDKIFIQYKNKDDAGTNVSGKPYKIQYSVDGNEFYDAVSVESATLNGAYTVDEVSAVEGNVRYVRVYYPQHTGYGMHIAEFAVIDTDRDATPLEQEAVPVPTVTASVPEGRYNTIVGTITANPDATEGTRYAIYVDGELVKTVDGAGDYELTDVTAGKHEVTVKAVSNGWSSEATSSITVEVKAPFTYTAGKKDTAFDANISVNGEAWYDYTDYEGVSASASDEAMPAKNAIDNDFGTRWGTASADPKELIIDLGSVRNINEVCMIWETASAKDYTIQVSTDGENYQTVATIAGANAGENRLDTIDFAEAVSARYVKMHGTARTTQYGYSIFEMAIYGPDEYQKEPVYEVSGVTATVDSKAKTAIINWTPSEDAVKAGYTYTVKIGENIVAEKVVATTGVSESIDVSNLEIGKDYVITVETADEKGEVVGTATGGLKVLPEEFSENAMVKVADYNLAYQKKASTSGSGQDVSRLTDGTYNLWNEQVELAQGVDAEGTYFQVDLGKAYTTDSIDKVVIWYRTGAANFNPTHNDCTGYEVQYSTDGTNFITVKNVAHDELPAVTNGAEWADNNEYMVSDSIDKAAAKELISAVQYVRVVYHGSIAYGAQANEMAVFNTEGNAQEYVENKIKPIEEPAGATWVEFPAGNGEYWYYIPAEYNEYFANFNTRADDLFMGCKAVAAPFKSIKVCGVDVALPTDNGAYAAIKKTDIEEYGVYKVDIVDYNGLAFSGYIKHTKSMDYKAKSLTATADFAEKTAAINWTPSEDAVAAGYTYTVKVGDLDAVVTGNTAACDISSLAEGTYTVTVNTVDAEGKVVATATTEMKYKDPDAVDSTVTFDTSAWEHARSEKVTWTKVDNAVGYAIYADGKLYKTIDDVNTLNVNVPAFAFANKENANGQKTTEGNHKTAVVALMEGETAPDSLDDVNAKRIMGSNEFTLYVNYIFGSQTDIWNNTGVDSDWNFTVCESADDPNINRGSSIKVAYNSQGTADLTFVDMGEHAGKDQAWTIKAAIYDQPIQNGQQQNLTFDIYGPAVLIGQEIAIRCYPDEWDEEKKDYGFAAYGDATYKFEDAGDGTAVLHYSTSFKAESATYDLVFGLGLLDFKDSEDKTITLTDAESVKIYGLTSMSATGVKKDINAETGQIYVAWTSDVPNRLLSAYEYKVYVDGELKETVAGDVYNVTLDGYATGEHQVKVESVYKKDKYVTSTKEDTAEIKDEQKPDLVVTNLSVTPGRHHVGDTIDITATMKNIGNVAADTNAINDDIILILKVDGVTVGYNGPASKKLEPGEEYTYTAKYTIKAHDDPNVDTYVISAEADDRHVVDEINENNNIASQTHIFAAALEEITFKFNAAAEKTVASWPADEGVTDYIVEYVVNGETKRIHTNSAEPNYMFEESIDPMSTVSVWIRNENGVLTEWARGIAKPDLIISKVDIPKNAYAVGEVVPITVTMKNVGVSTAVSNGNLTVKPTKNGEIVINNVQPLYRYMAEDNLEQKLNVGEEYKVTFNYTVQEADLQAGTIKLGGYADADNLATGGNVDESDETNNVSDVSIKIMEKGTLKLDSNNGDGPVTATWSAANEELVKGYKLKYTTDGENYKEIAINEENVVYDADKKEYTYTFPTEEGLFNETDVTIMVTFDEDTENGAYFDFASDKAMVDLVITNVTGPNEKGEKVRVKVNFDLTATVKNIGTAMVAPTTDDLEGYGKQIFVTLSKQADIPQVISKGRFEGLLVGATADFVLKDVVINEKGKKDLIVRADDAGWDWENNPEINIGYIHESNEENNAYTYSVNALIEQNPMDWTPLTVAQDSEEIFEFKLAQGTKDAHIEFKVVDTNNEDLDYKDIVTKYTGYNGMYMSIGFNPNYTGFTEVRNDAQGQIVSTVPYWAAINRKDVNTDIHTLPNCSIMDIEGWTIDGVGVDGQPVHKDKVPGTHFNRDGNGFNMNVDDFDVNSHYLLKLYQPNGDYVVLAFRVTDKYGEIGNWTQALGKDMDNDGMPFYYHDLSCETKGGFYYNKHDMQLSNIAAYNGNYISIDLDTQYKINPDNHKIILARGLIDGEGEMITPSPDGKTVEEGPETGSYYSCTGDLLNVNALEYYADESNYVVPEVYGINGNNKFQIMLPTLMKQMPIHSALGGQKDNEYYYMKIFWDEVDHPGEYVSIPIRIKADIPMIEDVNGLEVANRGSTLSVQWVSTTSQIAHGYLYDIYIDGELKAENVTAGSYNFTGYSQIGETHQIKVVAKWCEQKAEEIIEYEIKEPETEPEETIPADTPDFPRDDKWVLINGQNTLPVSIIGKLDQTNAEIWYYTDIDMKSVIGYNDYYISLNGSNKYFTGSDTRIYVQDENSTTFVSKPVYDSFYNGQTLMNASKMFSVPNAYVEGKEYFYVVRVAGDNGNTYKDFYFKVIPTKESGSITNTGDWRLISGEYKLPVKVGTESELMGTVRFLDCPDTVLNKYIGTNTYDIVGYNGYYMSIIGNNKYYTGEPTKISVSGASETVLYAEDAANLEFTEKPIADKAWPGQIIIKCADTFTVEYAKTYFLLKVESGEEVTYIPVEITVDTGEVEVLGFQMNTNQNEGAVASKSPSFRVVSKTSNVMTIGNKLYEVKKMGTVYAAADKVENLRDNMTLDGVASDEYIKNFETTDRGRLVGYTTTEADTNYNTYFALTFEFKDYMYHTLEQNYAFRAYAVLNDGTVVYGHNVYTTNMYEIAQNLYDNQKMGSEEAHNFLYKNILNLIDMDKNAQQIANAMFKAMGVKDYADNRYKLVSEMTNDIYNYARCRDGYSYKDREQFKCKKIEEELLGYLNTAQTEKGLQTYSSVYDWIYNETSNYSKKGVPYKGCYRLVDYGWDNTIDKDFYTE